MGIINPIKAAKIRIHKLARINQEINKLYYKTRTQQHNIERWKKRIRSKIQKKWMETQQRTLSLLGDKMSYMEIRLYDIA